MNGCKKFRHSLTIIKILVVCEYIYLKKFKKENKTCCFFHKKILYRKKEHLIFFIYIFSSINYF